MKQRNSKGFRRDLIINNLRLMTINHERIRLLARGIVSDRSIKEITGKVSIQMDKIEHIFQTSVEQLVREIVAVNHAWKAARELFGDDSPLSTSTRDLKTCLQVRL